MAEIELFSFLTLLSLICYIAALKGPESNVVPTFSYEIIMLHSNFTTDSSLISIVFFVATPLTLSPGSSPQHSSAAQHLATVFGLIMFTNL